MMYWPRRRQKAAGDKAGGFSIPTRDRDAYLSDELIEVNLVLRLEPSPLTTAIIASAMPAAIRPYSIAVAPDSSAKNFDRERFNSASQGCLGKFPMRGLVPPGN